MGKECSLGFGSSCGYWVKEEGMMSQGSTLNQKKKVPHFPEYLLGKSGKKKGNYPHKFYWLTLDTLLQCLTDDL